MQGDWPKKPVLASYDVVEKGGFVWLFNGSKMMPMDARPPIPFVPEVPTSLFPNTQNFQRSICHRAADVARVIFHLWSSQFAGYLEFDCATAFLKF